MLRQTVAAFIFCALLAKHSWCQTAPTSDVPAKYRAGSLGIGFDPKPVYPIELLLNPHIQKEFMLTDLQRKRLEDLEKRLVDQKKRLTQEFQVQKMNLGDSPDAEALQELMLQTSSRMKDAANESFNARVNVLQAKQRKRLEEIQIQAEGILAFSRPEFLARLNLSADQIDLIQPIVENGLNETRRASRVRVDNIDLTKEAPPPQGVNPHLALTKKYKENVLSSRNATVKARDESLQRIVKIMTKGQRARYQNLVGQPFDFVKLREAESAQETAAESAKQAEEKISKEPASPSKTK